MIGGAVLILGLLLLLTGLVSARIPGEATFASSGLPFGPRGGTDSGGGPLAVARRAGNPIRAFLLSPIHPATWYANAAIGLGLFVGTGAFAALVSILSAGLATLVAGVGLLLLVVGIEGSRLVARFERRRVAIADPRPLTAHPYRPLKGSLAELLRAEFADESRWRDVLYVALNFPLAVFEFVVIGTVWALALALLTAPLWDGAVTGTSSSTLDWFTGQSGEVVWIAVLVGAILLPVAASLSQLTMTLHRTVVAQLICTSEAGLLRRQVETLKESRSAVLNVEASELRRIERDLHDGAQQRLVMLSINLGMAAERMDSDPEAARGLVLEGREQARQALADLRSLVRGIAPAILIDRGLVAAISSIAARGAVPTSVQSDLPQGERLPEAIERAAYFVVAEALTNVAKHSGAKRCEVRCRLGAASLVVEVWDDGVGDARPGPGGGLAGLAGRVEALDGTFSISSPADGPTLVRAELPVPARVTTPGT